MQLLVLFELMILQFSMFMIFSWSSGSLSAQATLLEDAD